MSGCESAPRCACGCPARAHEHLRPGSDCGTCGRAGCPIYRATTARSLLVPAAALAITGMWLATTSVAGMAWGAPWWVGPTVALAAPAALALTWALVAETAEQVRARRATRRAAWRAATSNHLHLQVPPGLQVPPAGPTPADLDDAAVLRALEACGWSEQARRDAARLHHPSSGGRS